MKNIFFYGDADRGQEVNLWRVTWVHLFVSVPRILMCTRRSAVNSGNNSNGTPESIHTSVQGPTYFSCPLHTRIAKPSSQKEGSIWARSL